MISSSKQADAGDSDFLSGSWNLSSTTGSGQSECRRSFQGSGVKGVVPESSGGQQDIQEDGLSPGGSHHVSRLTFQCISP